MIFFFYFILFQCSSVGALWWITRMSKHQHQPLTGDSPTLVIPRARSQWTCVLYSPHGSQASMVKELCPFISFGSLNTIFLIQSFSSQGSSKNLLSFIEHEHEGEFRLKPLADKQASSGFVQGRSPQWHQKGEILLMRGYGGKVGITGQIRNVVLIVFMHHRCKNDVFAMFRCCGQESSSDGAQPFSSTCGWAFPVRPSGKQILFPAFIPVCTTAWGRCLVLK